jgi:hypothetical protein
VNLTQLLRRIRSDCSAYVMWSMSAVDLSEEPGGNVFPFREDVGEVDGGATAGYFGALAEGLGHAAAGRPAIFCSWWRLRVASARTTCSNGGLKDLDDFGAVAAVGAEAAFVADAELLPAAGAD